MTPIVLSALSSTFALGESMSVAAACDPLNLSYTNPFFFDATTWTLYQERFGREVELKVSYEDLLGNKYRYEAKIDASREIEPTRITGASVESIANSLAEIARTLQRFRPGGLPIGDSAG